MPIADTFARVYQIRALQDALEDRERKRDSERAITQLYSSGASGPEAIQKLLASGADPASVASIAKIYQGEGLARERALNLQSQRGVRGAEALAGAGMRLMEQWNALPEEKRTAAVWSRGYGITRANLIRQGIATPEMLPENLGPQDVEGMIGMGYSPAQQGLAAHRESEASARQSRFEQAQAAQQGRFQQSQAGIDRRAALARTAGGGRGGKEFEFDRTMAAAGIEPGSPEYVKAARIKARLEEGAGGGGFEMSYDDQGRPVVSMGTKGGKLTEQQAKNVINATAAEQAQAEIDRLRASGFDPTSAGGAAQVMAADLPIVGGLMPESAQAQASANRNLSAALNYARSGANITELEIENTKKALLDRYGDKPEVTEYKRKARQALIDAMKAGSPNVRAIVDDVLAQSSGGRTPSRSAQGQPAAQSPAPSLEDIDAEIQRRRSLAAGR